MVTLNEAPDQSIAEAKLLSATFVEQKKEEYKMGDGDEFLASLGEGMHTIMDETAKP
ncbi:MAG: hypothetical protein R2791_00600 [Saprospiraceae bacterium]